MSITLKGIIDEDFINYKLPAMTLMFPKCSFKCGAGCQNSALANEKDIKISAGSIYQRYINNPITNAVVMQGLEPFDSWKDVDELLFHFRIHESCMDDIVIYTGYDKHEIPEYIMNHIVASYSNIIIKYGRYIPNQKPHFDEVLGVKLASDNQYAERIN